MDEFKIFTIPYLQEGTSENIYLNGYTTFMLCQNNDIDIIKEQRMHLLINIFTNYNNHNFEKYVDYYKNNIIDNYVFKINKSDNTTIYSKKEEYDEIVEHYKDISNKYTAINNFIMNKLQDNDKDSIYDDINIEELSVSNSTTSEYSDYFNDEDEYFEYFDDLEDEDDDYDY